MDLRTYSHKLLLGSILLSAASLTALGQQSSRAAGDRAALDAQTESNVIIALDSAPTLKDQQIAASTIDGDVTLTGMVNDEASRQLAEQVASRVKGVRSVSDKLTVASIAENQQSAPAPAAQGPVPQNEQAMAGAPPIPADNTAATDAQSAAPYPYPSGPAPRQEDTANSAAADNQPQGPPPPPAQTNGYPQDYPQNNPQNSSQTGNQGYPQNSGDYGDGRPPAPRHPYNDDRQYDDHRYDDRYNDPNYNRRSGPVTLPASTMLRVRTTDFLDTRKLQPGSVFEVTAANDVFVAGVLAVPRGATLEGVVTDERSSTSGSMTGSNALTLKLTHLDLEGRSYPLDTDLWTGQGPGKGAYSANNTIGGAAVGAVIGAMIGRGPGAAIGAVAGGATGAAASSASSGPRMVLPPETILTFHLAHPLTVDPVSYREAQRLASSSPPSGQPSLRPRAYYPPPPPPYYYGPAYGPSFYYQYGRPW